MVYPVSKTVLDALHHGARLQPSAIVSYDGQPVQNLEVLPGGSIQVVREAQSIGSTLRLPVADPDGSLSDLRLGAPLMPFGARIHLSIGVGSVLIPVGVYSITRTEIRSGGGGRWVRDTWIPGAREVVLHCDDLLQILADEQLADPWASQSGVVGGEVRRLLAGILPTEPLPSSIENVGVWAGTVWEGTRLSALSGLLASADAIPEMGRSGAVRAIPQATLVPTSWVLPEDTTIVHPPQMSKDTLINAVVLTGTTSDGAPIRGQAVITDGPLRFGGPVGRRVKTENNPLMRTQSAINQAAQTRLDGVVATRTVEVQVTTPVNPAIDMMDGVMIRLGRTRVPGQVVGLDYPIDGGMMRVMVAVPWRAVFSA